VSDIDTAEVDSLKALDPNRPIREATKLLRCRECPLCAIRVIRCDAETDGLFSISDEPPYDTRVPVGELSTSIADIAGGATIPAARHRGVPRSMMQQVPAHNLHSEENRRNEIPDAIPTRGSQQL
jgi:hypothetical protein